MQIHRTGPADRVFPAWALVLAGALAACAWRERMGATQPAAPESAPDPGEVLVRGSARELRALPGIGERRALDLVEARWRHGPADPPLYLHDLPGLGPAIEAAVGAVLAAAQRGPADAP